MKIIKVNTTKEQRDAAKEAALQRYKHQLKTPNRPGWTGGKCPVSEYRALVAEIGACTYLGYDWKELVLFSTNSADYKRPDVDDWEIKSGSTFSNSDIAKGAKRILWVTPWNKTTVHYCGYATCADKVHTHLDGTVEIRGWTDLNDLHLCTDFGNYYKPAGKAFRSAATIKGGTEL